MPVDRFLEFHDSKVIAVSLTPERAVIDLHSSIIEWADTGPESRGTAWWQGVRLEIANPRVSSAIKDLSAWISGGRVVSPAFAPDDDGEDELTIPVVIDAAVRIQLDNVQGERLDIAGTRLSASLVGERNGTRALPPGGFRGDRTS